MAEQNSEAEYLSDDDDEVENTLPKQLTVWLVIIFGLCALVSLALIIFYALKKDAKPSELNLGTVLIYCLTALVIVLIPWKKLGLRLKKVGFVEFERVIKTQKKEQILEIVSLQNQIDQLKGIPPIETGPVAERAVEPIAGTSKGGQTERRARTAAWTLAEISPTLRSLLFQSVTDQALGRQAGRFP
jgi:hypothetical protein